MDYYFDCDKVYKDTMDYNRHNPANDRKSVYMALSGYYPDEIVGATDAELEAEIRQTAGYCSQPTVPTCRKCSLCNYGLDCHNNKVA